jgi:hypothetical protein
MAAGDGERSNLAEFVKTDDEPTRYEVGRAAGRMEGIALGERLGAKGKISNVIAGVVATGAFIVGAITGAAGGYDAGYEDGFYGCDEAMKLAAEQISEGDEVIELLATGANQDSVQAARDRMERLEEDRQEAFDRCAGEDENGEQAPLRLPDP